MSHKISQNLKGALGEMFVKREFEKNQLVNSFDSVEEMSFKNRPPIGTFHMDWYREFNKRLIKKFGTLVLPDFLVKGTKILIEVKTGKYAKLEKNQLKEFPFILKKGFRIFIIRPKLLIEKRKFEVIDFYCIEFLGRNKRTKITLDTLKQLIKKQIKN